MIYSIQVSEHIGLILMCISGSVYAYQLRCTKQVVLMTLENVFLLPPSLQKQPFMAVCSSAGIRAACGCAVRVLRTTKLLPKVVIYITEPDIHIKVVKECSGT